MRRHGVLVVVAVGLLAAGTADARPTRTCKSADLRYPFTAGGPNTFGVFKLMVTGGKCRTAHRAAKAWQTKFEGNLKAGSEKLPTSAAGFTFTQLPVHEAQTYRLRGRRGTTSVRFDYVVPNG
jgi:hypothetical protein